MPPIVKAFTGLWARNCYDALTIGHHDVLALTSDAKAGLLKRPDGVEVIDARDTRHALDDLYLAYISIAEEFVADREILADRLADIRQCFGLSRSLGPAARQTGD